MPLAPNSVERLIFLTLNQAPGPALDLWSGPAFRIVLAGIRLGVFVALAEQPATVDELAGRLVLDRRGAGLLVDALASLGYLTQRNGRTHLSPLARKWLTDAGDINFAPFFRYWGAILEEFFPSLEASLRMGRPPANLYAWLEQQPEVSRYFQEGMIAITRYVKNDVVKAIHVPDRPCRLLDLGGGHAMYSVALCQQHPQLSAVVVDGAQALATGQLTVDAAQLGTRVMLHEGNFLVDPLGGDFDLVLLFNVVHGLTAEENLTLLHKVKAALTPGGQVIILEQLAGDALLPLQNTIVRLLGVSYFHLLGGQTYTFGDIKSWLTSAGFDTPTRRNIVKAGSPLIMARSLP